MPKPLLPSLIPGNKVTAFGNAGKWVPRNASELKLISDGLNVAKQGVTPTEVDSIPSMWARPLLFQMALYDDKHPVHTQVLGEWRGLLAMLALKEWSEFPITTEQVEIDVAKNPEAAADFLRALAKLRPTDTLSDLSLPDPATWEVLNIILFDGEPIGIASPTTLVCTSVNCFGRISDVPWFDNRRFLVDPVRKLNVSEKEAVKYWLTTLQEGTAKLPILDITVSLNKLLLNFINQLNVPLKVFDFSITKLGLTQDLFKYMNQPVVAPKGSKSSIKLVHSKNKKSKENLLVFDKDIHKAWRVEPQNVIVWKGKTLATSQNSSGTPELVLPEDVELQTPQDFFIDKLFVIKQKKAFHKGSTLASKGSRNINFNGSPVTPILPLTTKLLTYLDVEDLNDRITFNQLNDRIVVELRLTLNGIDGKGNSDFVISKEYDKANVRTIATAPVLAVWPNFRTQGWKAYYTYFTTADQDAFYAKPLPAAKESDTLPDPLTFQDNSGNVKKETTKTEHFPEAMLCEYKGAKAGILLISAPEALNANTNKANTNKETIWTVGVDFGSSSTTVYRYSNADNEPQSVTFDKKHILRITDPLTSSKIAFYKDFLSHESKSTPFFSLFQTLQTVKPDEPLLDGHIYFPDNHNDISSDKRIVSDLKWSSTINRRHIQVFLKQLCLQTAAEAVNDGAQKIDWNFSHPLAFTRQDKGQFELIWKSVGAACGSATGVNQKVVTPAQSESVVTAKFFASTLQNPTAIGDFTSGAVCIDIGGETSDISIWQNNKLYWQTSIKFAGRHIFLNLLKENPEFLKELGVNENGIKLLKEIKDDKFYAQADALIETEGQDWLSELPNVENPSIIQPFLQLISLGVSGLLYYVGLLLTYLSKVKPESDLKSEIPSIYIGGNGSNILHWMADGSFDPDNSTAQDCRKYLKKVICKASGFAPDDNNRDIEISHSPKKEAAYGLVIDIDETELDFDPDTQFDVLAGETFTENGIEYPWTEVLTAERLHNRLSIPKRFDKIQHFIDSFNQNLGEGIKKVSLKETVSGKEGDSATVSDAMFAELEKVFQAFSNRDPGKISIEPLFILALKELLRAKTRRWINMDG